MKNLSDLKQYLKTTAFAIKTNKPIAKAGPNGSNHEAITAYYRFVEEVRSLRWSFRHHLISYCEMRGLQREQIEKPAETNRPSEDEIRRIKTEYAPVWRSHEATIHTCA